MKPLVILGTGLGGYSLARKLDPDLAIVLISADDGRYYSKPMLSNAYASAKTPEGIANADAAAMAKQLNAEVRPWTTVTAVDPAAHTVSTGAQALEYHKLVFALGAGDRRLGNRPRPNHVRQRSQRLHQVPYRGSRCAAGCDHGRGTDRVRVRQ